MFGMKKTMSKFCHPFFVLLILSLTACEWLSDTISKSSPSKVSTELTKEEINNRCIYSHHEFPQGHADGLYGIKCINGKKLLIKTDEEGSLISNTEAGDGLRLEKTVDGKTKKVGTIPGVINEFYKLGYNIQKNKGDDKDIPFLRKLLPQEERFYGSRKQDYHVIFKVIGNHLVLFKASKNIEHIPYTQRTVLSRSEDGEYIPSEDGYYMVPFIGYSIRYCVAEKEREKVTNRVTKGSVKKCKGISEEDNPDYIELQINNPKPYNYIANKKNIFPAKYFEGSWFFSRGKVQTEKVQAHHYSQKAYLVELEKRPNALELKIKGEISEFNKARANFLSVEWKEYEMDKNGDSFNTFSEREDTTSNTNETEKPYVKLNFELQTGEEISEIIITEDYFSFVKTNIVQGKEVKTKYSLLRESTLNQKDFHEKRCFSDDLEHRFSVLPVFPETEKESGALELEDKMKFCRLTHFNTSEKDTVIKWHFSNYTVKNNKDNIAGNEDDKDGDFYRELGQEAVNRWNRAFEIITRDYCKKLKKEENCKTIKVVLANEEEGDKDLGDLRYNILNLVKEKVLSNSKRSGLIGHAPSYVKADTGQALGTTANVFIHNISEIYEIYVNNYIRYEIFRKEKNTNCKTADNNSCEKNETKEIHAVSPYIKAQIETLCPEVVSFVSSKKAQGPLKPRDDLKDSHVIASCEKKISRDQVLYTILHEMGHSLSLGHNFKASTDQNNFYRSLKEIKTLFPMATVQHLPKSSSVMDYTPTHRPPLTVPGKYDIAVLRYIYLNQIETKNEDLISLKIPENPSEQTPLSENILSQMKDYASCWDTVLNGNARNPFGISIYAEDFLCLISDYGSSPEEIVKNDIDDFKRSTFSAGRYSYGNNVNPFAGYSRLDRILEFYMKWHQLKDDYVREKGLEDATWFPIDGNQPLTAYYDVIENKLCSEEQIQEKQCMEMEYNLYYPTREIVADFIMDTLLLETMKCEIYDNNEEQVKKINLESIKNRLHPIYGENLYVEDCESELIQSFFAENNSTYMGQSGFEDFKSYFPKGTKNYAKAKNARSQLLTDILPITRIRDNAYHKFIEPLIYDPYYFQLLLERFRNNLINSREKGFSKSDLTYAERTLKRFSTELTKIARHIKFPISQKVVSKNAKYFKSQNFNTGSGYNSFFKKITEPLNNGFPPTTVFRDTPFLLDAYSEAFEDLEEEYKKYKKENGKNTKTLESYVIAHFEEYVIQRADTMDRTEVYNTFTIPVISNNLVAIKYRKYHENLEKLERLEEEEKKRALTPFEEMKKEALNEHNRILRNY